MNTKQKTEDQTVKTEQATIIVDLDADPIIHASPIVLKQDKDWEIVEHIKGGQFEFNPTKVVLYLEKEQQDGGVIIGTQLREKLKSKPVYNANLLNFYLKHHGLIPEEWKGKEVFFWGTIYRNPSGTLGVRSLFWDGHWWLWRFRMLGAHFTGNTPAVVAA